jgi:hypothetical protein
MGKILQTKELEAKKGKAPADGRGFFLFIY